MTLKKQNGHATKKCYGCGTYLPLEVDRCQFCKRRVGPPDKNGVAKPPINWMGYVLAVAAWGVFGAYIWWAFIR